MSMAKRRKNGALAQIIKLTASMQHRVREEQRKADREIRSLERLVQSITRKDPA